MRHADPPENTTANARRRRLIMTYLVGLDRGRETRASATPGQSAATPRSGHENVHARSIGARPVIGVTALTAYLAAIASISSFQVGSSSWQHTTVEAGRWSPRYLTRRRTLAS